MNYTFHLYPPFLTTHTAKIPCIGYNRRYGVFCVQLHISMNGGECVKEKKTYETGRKGLYKKWLEEDNLLRLEGWARDGLTDVQIAHNIGIHIGTLYEWKKRYPKFNDAIKRGKEVVDIIVENALLKSALGYRYDEVTKVRIDDEASGKSEIVEVKRVTKDMAPNPTSLIFWLKNRKPEVWRDSKKVDANIEVNNPFDGIDTADIKALIDDE